jgi:hypothetical protein
MLYVLTGGIQTGKTRWLERLVCDLEPDGVPCFGVISPGIWRKQQAGDGTVEYEKLGIESVFLPNGTRVLFARRRDLAESEDTIEAGWQSSQAELGWAIPDEAIASVNRHFDALESQIDALGTEGRGYCPTGQRVSDGVVIPAGGTVAPSLCPTESPGLLIVDELGRLELERGCGFVAAVRLLERGPTCLYRHALVVARDWLVELALARFSVAWGQVQRITPDEEAHRQITTLIRGKGENSACELP